MISIFRNTEIQEKIRSDGYAVLPLLKPNEIDKLLSLFHKVSSAKKDAKAKLFVSSRDCDFETSLYISNEIKDILLPHLETIAFNFSLYGGAFLAKPKHDSNEFSFHQDFTLMEPDKHQMYAIWIALQDTNQQNGAVFLIEKSQQLFKSYISASYNNNKIDRKDIDPDFVKSISLKAGDMLLFCDSLFHGSFSNLSDKERIAITARITDKDAPFVYYQKLDDDTAGVYSIHPTDLIKYFTDFQQGNLPDHLTLKYTISYRHSPVTSKKLNNKLKDLNGKSTGFLEKIIQVFR